MKIWFPVIRGASGTDVFTQRLASALQKRDVEAELSWFPASFELAPWLLCGTRPPVGTAIIHANSWNAYAFHRKEIPLVVTRHLDISDSVYRRYKTAMQAAYHRLLVYPQECLSLAMADGISAVSRQLSDSTSAIAGKRVVNIPTWVDTQVFRPLRVRKRKPSEPFRLLFVGNLSRRKGVDMLAPIMANLGDGYEINVTAGLRGKSIAKLGIRNATAVGRIIGTSDLVRLYNNSDALLFPSRLEGLSFVLLEAMACGLPVIAARASSMPEVVVHDKTGFLCRPDDADDFADAIRRLAADRDRAMAMGDAGRQRIEEVYDERTVIPRYIELYRDTLSRSPGGVIS